MGPPSYMGVRRWPKRRYAAHTSTRSIGAEWALEPFRTLLKRETSLDHARNRTWSSLTRSKSANYPVATFESISFWSWRPPRCNASGLLSAVALTSLQVFPCSFSFHIYRSAPAVSRSSSSVLPLGGFPFQNLLFYGRGILPQYMSNPFPQSDLYCRCFFCARLQRSSFEIIFVQKISKIFPKAPVYKCL